jgi:hypothetical protein
MLEPAGPHDRDDRIMPAFIAACPSFTDVWQTHVDEWHASADRGIYIDLAAFAEHLVSLLRGADTSEFPSVFATVETLLDDRDEDVRYAVKVGLLEALGNIASNQKDWPFAAGFRSWFGPTTAAAWDELHQFWGTSDRG